MAKKLKPRKLHREQIVANVRKALATMDAYFADVESWNENSRARKEGAAPIDPDPNGELAKIRERYRALLKSEDARPLPTFGPVPVLPQRMM